MPDSLAAATMVAKNGAQFLREQNPAPIVHSTSPGSERTLAPDAPTDKTAGGKWKGCCGGNKMNDDNARG
jgi:hypothetical protein